LESINEIINCSQGIFVIFRRDLLGDPNSDQMGMVVQKNIVEGKYTDLVSITDTQVPDPAFTKFKDARNPI